MSRKLAQLQNIYLKSHTTHNCCVEDGAALALIPVDPRVGGQEEAAQTAKQGRPRITDGRALGDAWILGRRKGQEMNGFLILRCE